MLKYEGKILNGTMHGEGRAEYANNEASLLAAVLHMCDTIHVNYWVLLRFHVLVQMTDEGSSGLSQDLRDRGIVRRGEIIIMNTIHVFHNLLYQTQSPPTSRSTIRVAIISFQMLPFPPCFVRRYKSPTIVGAACCNIKYVVARGNVEG